MSCPVLFAIGLQCQRAFGSHVCVWRHACDDCDYHTPRIVFPDELVLRAPVDGDPGARASGSFLHHFPHLSLAIHTLIAFPLAPFLRTRSPSVADDL